MLKTFLPTSSITEEFSGTATFQVPRQDLIISDLFTEMESHGKDNDITDWGINQTSLEDVFLTIVRNEEDTGNATK